MSCEVYLTTQIIIFMDDIIIYHNTRCGKSRGALEILREKGIEPKIRFYLKEPSTREELKEVLGKLQIKAADLIRKKEQVFKDNFKGKSFSEEEWMKIIIENPILMERPIVIKGNKAVVARPPEKVLEIL